jgi:hypothetical protein
MVTDLLFVVFGMAIAMGFIILVAWLLQRRFERRQITPSTHEYNWGEGPDPSPDLTNKIRSHTGIDIQDLKIITRLDVPFSRDSIVLLNRSIEPHSNLLRCHRDGSILWIAIFPPYTFVHVDDLYTFVAWDKEKLTAYACSGFHVILDLKTGEILESRFTK